MMDISDQTLYQEITDKLKTVPKEVLERISAYLSEIDENKDNLNFKLSEEQKESLSKIKERPYSEHTEVNIFLNEMSEKYP
ncbi:hypothetical protein ACFO4P_16650 [Epilithonimonas pallida]|uniref:Addiction module component n=1 Tax=Epilithonimonas pallida TaxID=373671 RepID=A0ABY1R732_9FLAO|nr:hypothetical protein [Epilithonimonas pallida]SMP94601.1 hypothetical protein SAMN05421679_10613 [Epilithonimonas pallida]